MDATRAASKAVMVKMSDFVSFAFFRENDYKNKKTVAITVGLCFL